jgi:hypothetical protein
MGGAIFESPGFFHHFPGGLRTAGGTDPLPTADGLLTHVIVGGAADQSPCRTLSGFHAITISQQSTGMQRFTARKWLLRDSARGVPGRGSEKGCEGGGGMTNLE